MAFSPAEIFIAYFSPVPEARLYPFSREGLRWALGLPDKLPALRLLLVLDNLA
jgi:hypothetical protein